MESNQNAGVVRAMLSQPVNNTTTWIGHLQSDPVSHFAGQTFTAPEDGLLVNIQVYSSLVQHPGRLSITLHEFDNDTKVWTNAFAEASSFVHSSDRDKWISFYLDYASLAKDKTYGFKLHSEDALIGIGELARNNDQPCAFGQEWNANSNNMSGSYFTWFSLAFKLEMAI